MRRLLLPLACLIALLAVPATGHAYTLGISDQQASTFDNPLFAPLKSKAVRYIAPYDVMSSPDDLAKATAWLEGAQRANQRILISFEHSRREGRERRLPSVREFEREMRKFKARFPFVREISPWNEVNRCQSAANPTVGQPTCGKERRLAQYYSVSRRVFRGAKIVALDVLDERDVAKTLRVIERFLSFARPRPTILGFHNYSDTNRFSTKRTRAVLKLWPGKVWLTETGGIVKLGKSFPYNENRAARALGCMFTIAKQFTDVQRLYVYQFNGAASRNDRFDAGLVSATNEKRPGYDVVRKRAARRCSR